MTCSDFDIPVEVFNYFDMDVGAEGGLPFFDGEGSSENALRKVMQACMDAWMHGCMDACMVAWG
jgi:hypothetical protein